MITQEVKTLPTVAAVPNYNMGSQLKALLPELAAQDYADIFVLDDASTDGSHEVVEAFNTGSGVQFIANRENMGAAGARNQIMHALGYDAVIHFIDADVTLETGNVVDTVHDILPDGPFGFVGGLAKTPSGIQNAWNYGPHQDIHTHLTSQLQARIELLITSDPDKARDLRQRFDRFLEGYPFPLDEPVPKKVFWAIEQNLLVRSDIFEAIGGFNPKLRENEVQDLAIRMHNQGLPRYFDPAIVVEHKDEQDVRDYNRSRVQNMTELRIAWTHGLRNYLFPGNRFSV